MAIIMLCFMIYPDLNLVMNSIRILNNNEISLNFRAVPLLTLRAFVAYKNGGNLPT